MVRAKKQTRTAKKPSVGLYIGASPETITTMRDAVLAVINGAAADKVKIVALDALRAGVAVSGTTVSGCTFYPSEGR